VIIIGNYSVISDVGESLLALLRDLMPTSLIASPEQIGLVSPAETGNIRLGLFLYSIRENGDSRQTTMITKGKNELQFPPMPLMLYYLVSAYSKAELASRTVDEALILGKAMEILFDHSVIRSKYLQGTLAQNNEEPKIAFDNLHTDVLLRLWNFPNVPYRPSLSYAVGPILLNSNRTKPIKRVTEVNFHVKG
jgi:hypothetical protein